VAVRVQLLALHQAQMEATLFFLLLHQQQAVAAVLEVRQRLRVV
jgi:hypothetical protein